MMGKIQTVEINDHIWLLNDGDATGYLVVGTERGLVIDTMNGYEDVGAAVRRITALPLTVINTHGHPDHIYGNIYFEQAYLHPDDLSIAQSYYKSEDFKRQILKPGLKPAELLPVREGDSFHLGGISLEIYELPGHTPGGIVLLDRKDRILFTGDSINHHTWMQLSESLPMEDFRDSLKKVQDLRGAFDTILTGHCKGPVAAEMCEAHFKAVEELCRGETENDEPYIWFDRVSMAHPYGDGSMKIVYNPDKDR